MTRSVSAFLAVAAAIVAAVACTSASGSSEATESAAASASQEQKLDHVWPPRDFIGARPDYFEWTKVDRADHYAIGVFDEVDRLMWRSDHVADVSVDLPKDVPLELGTYFWTVIALGPENQPLANSGRSAFVITR